jgi:hypothetical protein
MSNELLQVYQKKLDTMRPFITLEDRKDLIKTGLVSRPTLDAYLKGDVTKVGTAHIIIDFLESRIEKRIKQYKKQNAA